MVELAIVISGSRQPKKSKYNQGIPYFFQFPKQSFALFILFQVSNSLSFSFLFPTQTQTCLWSRALEPSQLPVSHSLAQTFSLLLRRMTGPPVLESVTLDLLKKKMQEFAKERNWEQFHSPRNLLLALVCNIIHLYLFLYDPKKRERVTQKYIVCLFVCGYFFFLFYQKNKTETRWI